MTNLGLLDAWSLWLDGQSTIGHTLYGIPMIWVGRAGKILAFISAFAVLVDIVGPDRISRYGRWLTNVDEPIETKTAYVFAYLLIGLAVAGVALTLRIMHVPLDTTWHLTGLPALLVPLTAIGVPATAVIFGPRFLGWLFSKPGFATAIRILSLAGLIIGFHFDLLAS
ncbi:hypothetical protein [Microbispora sp. ATCC PTA-5024]|uniref:hypothetical protein n=1 Tax=Microbispora sp. ATCC PTA-5024 TaxID=316330 RepID=UPI0003DD1E57|nr:hypothetical protein [Microbispora sp. ATCC PTA-5024]ETK31651.1 hypothetical protein MPTA5024_34155 [Microbispora sp. ATCC PTA-5024]